MLDHSIKIIKRSVEKFRAGDGRTVGRRTVVRIASSWTSHL